jgi:hypothetical protein
VAGPKNHFEEWSDFSTFRRETQQRYKAGNGHGVNSGVFMPGSEYRA